MLRQRCKPRARRRAHGRASSHVASGGAALLWGTGTGMRHTSPSTELTTRRREHPWANNTPRRRHNSQWASARAPLSRLRCFQPFCAARAGADAHVGSRCVLPAGCSTLSDSSPGGRARARRRQRCKARVGHAHDSKHVSLEPGNDRSNGSPPRASAHPDHRIMQHACAGGRSEVQARARSTAEGRGEGGAVRAALRIAEEVMAMGDTSAPPGQDRRRGERGEASGERRAGRRGETHPGLDTADLCSCAMPARPAKCKSDSRCPCPTPHSPATRELARLSHWRMALSS